MSPELAALLAGPLGAASVLVLKWLLDRRRNNAETGLTVDRRWEQWSKKLEDRLDEAEADVTALKARVTELEESLDRSERQGIRLKLLLSSLARWALTLRDELLKSGGTVPPMPLDVETALTALDHE